MRGPERSLRGLAQPGAQARGEDSPVVHRRSQLLLGGSACPHSSVSHSVLSEMQVIEQETPVSAKSSRSQLDLFDDVGTFASGPPK